MTTATLLASVILASLLSVGVHALHLAVGDTGVVDLPEMID